MAIKNMTVEELNNILQRDPQSIELIDCRELGEWNDGHIPQAQFRALSEISEWAEDVAKSKKTLVLQCRSGKRSMTACQKLEELGHQDLYNLEGGILSWMDHNFEIQEE